MYAENAPNLSQLLRQRVALSPDAIGYRQYDGQRWVDYRWREVEQLLARWHSALAAFSLSPGDRVAICANNRLEWALFDQAALSLGLVVVPLYYNDRFDNMAWCLQDAGARMLLLEDGSFWQQLAPLCQTLEHVVCISNTPAAIPGDNRRATALADWLPSSAPPMRYADSVASDLATIVYTSGTTGRPKGVMLSHGNILSNVFALAYGCPEIADHDDFLSFLPLSHMLERTVGYYIAIYIGAKTIFARGITQLGEDLVQQRPTVIVSVPRIFERVYQKIQEQHAEGSVAQRLFDFAVSVGWRRRQGQARLGDHLLWPLLYVLVARRLQARFGGRLRYILLGGAPMPKALVRIYMGLGFTFLQGYGLTETSPAISFSRVSDNNPWSVGTALDGVETRFAENGELLARGPNIMLGYWNNEAATQAVIDKDGWFHTGDVAHIEDGEIFITDRIKDIIVLSNGEKISPTDVEQAILQDTHFDQLMVVGEGRPRLGLLLVSHDRDTNALCRRANQQLKGFPGYVSIDHIAVLDEPWTVENGLLTPTLKPRRRALMERYQEQIEAMYRSKCNSD